MTTGMTTTIRVSVETHRQLIALAAALDVPIAEVTARAVELLNNQLFWEQTNAAYAALRADPEASAAFDAEIDAWDSTLQDGLEAY